MRKAILGGAAAALVAVLAGCSPAHHHHPLASASALASNSAIVTDKTIAKAHVTGCINKVGIVTLVRHTKAGTDAVIACLEQYSGDPATFKARAQALIQSNGFTAGALTKDEVGLAGLLVKG